MIIKTRILPATTTDSQRMRATADNGASLTIPFPYESDDHHRAVASMLARAYGYRQVEHTTGNTYRAT